MPGATNPKLMTGPDVGEGGPLSSTLKLPLLCLLLLPKTEGMEEEIRGPWLVTIFSRAAGSMAAMKRILEENFLVTPETDLDAAGLKANI